MQLEGSWKKLFALDVIASAIEKQTTFSRERLTLYCTQKRSFNRIKVECKSCDEDILSQGYTSSPNHVIQVE